MGSDDAFLFDKERPVMASNLSEVLEYGPICAVDENGALVTVNGSYLNLWVADSDGAYRNVDCATMTRDLYTTTGAEMIDLAEAQLKHWLNFHEEGGE